MDKFEKKLNDKIMYSFSTAKEWSDLMSILKDLKALIIKYEKDVNMDKLQDKVTFTKRLAQCLNTSLPGGLHEVAIETYDIILNNILSKNNNCLGEDLGLYASGLFPFFQNATSQNKTEFLNKIILKNFLKLQETELELCLPGLLVSILPGLEEQNETNTKIIKEIFSNSKKIVSDEIFYGCLWSIIIRTQRMRQAGMKYISETIPNYNTYNESNDAKKAEILKNYYPKMHTMIINSLCTIIQEDDLQTQRIGMDFLITRFPLNNSILSDDEKVTLLISCLSLLEKNEYSMTRRLSKYLVGTDTFEDELDTNEPEIQYMIGLLIKAFKKIFLIENVAKTQLMANIKIIEQLLNQQVALIDQVLENVSFDLVRCIEKYWEITLKSSENCENDELIKKAHFFFSKDDLFIESLWKSLGNHIANCVNNSCEKNDINDSIKLLKFSLLFISIKSNKNKIKFYLPIISCLLKVISKVEVKSRESIKEIRQSLLLALVFTQSFQERNRNEFQTQKSMIHILTNIMESVVSDNANLTSLINKFSDKEDNSKLMKNKEYAEMVNDFTENMFAYQKKYLDLIDELVKIPEKQMTRNERKFFIVSTELLIRIQVYDRKEEVPTWIYYLERIAFGDNISLALEATYYLINLIMVNIENPSYKKIEEHLKYDELKDTVINKDLLTLLLTHTHVKINCIELLIARLWFLLEDQENQKKVIDLLINISHADLETFVNTLSNTFAMNEFQSYENAIKKFSQFWKLLNEYYPDVIFFKNGECIFKMLDFLDHEHPLLRHLSKSWLNQSVSQFNKILDPLLLVLLSKDTSWKIDTNNQLYFDQECDNRRIIDVFRKLKNIIINTTDLAIKYFIEHKCTKELVDTDEIGKQIEVKNKDNSSPRDYYLGLMVSISLRFIQGQLLQELTKTVSKENFSVNAAACEFLEFLLNFIENKAKLMDIALQITIPVFDILARAIKDQDEVMQVQLLNLLKVLLLNTKNEHLNRKQEVLVLLNNKILLDCLIKGIQINYFFVRGHFIYFVECCLPIFSKILDSKEQVNISLNLINTTIQFLFSRVVYKTDMKSEDEYSIFNTSEKSKFVYKNYLEEYKEVKNFDENDINIIVKGLKEVLFHFLQIKPFQENDWNEIKMKLPSSKSSNAFGDYLKNLFSSNSFEETDTKNFKMSINKEIYMRVSHLLASFTSCWINQSEVSVPSDYCLTDKGVLPYQKTDEGMKEYKKIEEDSQPNQLKNQIIEIAKNIFYANPLQFFGHFILLWKNKKNEYFKPDKTDKLYQLSMIEILIGMNIPLELIFSCINCLIALGINEKIKTYERSKSKNYLISFDQSIEEAQLCHFLYSYILINKTTDKTLNTIDIWEEAIRFFESFLETKTGYTICWIYELLNLLLYKVPFKTSSNDSTYRKYAADVHLKILKKLTDIMFNDRFESVYEEDNFFVTPITPTIYQNTINVLYPGNNISQKNSLETMSSKNNMVFSVIQSTEDYAMHEHNKNDAIYLFYQQYFHDIIQNNKKPAAVLMNSYRYIVMITVKSLFYSTMNNCYHDKSNDMKYQFDKMIKSLLLLMTPKLNNADFLKDLSIEMLMSLLSDSPSFVCLVGKQMIMDFFLNDDFFVTTPKRIRIWKSIFEEIANYNNNIIGDLLNQMDSGFLLAKSSATKIKILRRISFVIYSCKKDTFSSKLVVLKEKVKELIIQCADTPILEGEIFLMIRILFLRFSHENVMDMIRALWPIIFSELVTIIKAKRMTKSTMSIELLFESFKLVELLSLANIDEFSLYQWIFIIDTFDIKRLDGNDKEALMASILENSKLFKPIAMDICDDWKSFPSNLTEKGKTNLIITDEATDKDSLIQLVKKFFYSIGDMNNFRVKVNYSQIEDIIEKDFLN